MIAIRRRQKGGVSFTYKLIMRCKGNICRYLHLTRPQAMELLRSDMLVRFHTRIEYRYTSTACELVNSVLC